MGGAGYSKIPGFPRTRCRRKFGIRFSGDRTLPGLIRLIWRIFVRTNWAASGLFRDIFWGRRLWRGGHKEGKAAKAKSVRCRSRLFAKCFCYIGLRAYEEGCNNDETKCQRLNVVADKCLSVSLRSLSRAKALWCDEKGSDTPSPPPSTKSPSFITIFAVCWTEYKYRAMSKTFFFDLCSLRCFRFRV